MINQYFLNNYRLHIGVWQQFRKLMYINQLNLDELNNKYYFKCLNIYYIHKRNIIVTKLNEKLFFYLWDKVEHVPN